VLRIEDLDRPRSRPEWTAGIIEDLRWLGLDWDEGPDVGGPYGPYLQSERSSLYEDAFERLRSLGTLYPCYCSRAELMNMALAPHGLASEGGAYSGRCYRLDERERRELEKRKMPSWRFHLPDEPFHFVDGARGPQEFPAGAGGDFVVRRADGIIGYQLAVAVDDAAMGITDVLRGDDLLDSTPRQALILRALDLPVPRYTHIPLLYGPDGRRLSKRHGAPTIADMRETGVRPEQVVGLLAFLAGQIDRPENISARELIPLFDLSRVHREGILLKDLTMDKLWYNKEIQFVERRKANEPQ